jgi:hypothetical protein
MIGFFVAIWTIVIFLSITWYGILLFYVGVKGGKEIRTMTKLLSQKQPAETDSDR